MDQISPAALRKLSRELHALDNDPPEGIKVIDNNDTITDIQAWILGPGNCSRLKSKVNSGKHMQLMRMHWSFSIEGTPYDGGCFRLRIQLSPDFPDSPPKCKALKLRPMLTELTLTLASV